MPGAKGEIGVKVRSCSFCGTIPVFWMFVDTILSISTSFCSFNNLFVLLSLGWDWTPRINGNARFSRTSSMTHHLRTVSRIIQMFFWWLIMFPILSGRAWSSRWSWHGGSPRTKGQWPYSLTNQLINMEGNSLFLTFHLCPIGWQGRKRTSWASWYCWLTCKFLYYF